MTEQKHNEGSHGNDLDVFVTNENNSGTDTFKAGPGTPVATIIEQLYASKKLGIPKRYNDDRLQCEGGGDILQFSALHLGELAEKHCKSLRWRFAGGTGGA